MGFDTQTVSASLPFIDKVQCTCSTKEKVNVFGLFLPHCMSARGCADALVGLLRYARGYSDLPKHNEVQIAIVVLKPPLFSVFPNA